MKQTHAQRMTKKYRGRPFIFHSPFENTPGWRDGDRGVLVRCLPKHGDDIEDLWKGRRQDRKQFDLWGGEAFDPETNKPVVREHRFTEWRPPPDSHALWALVSIQTGRPALTAAPLDAPDRETAEVRALKIAVDALLTLFRVAPKTMSARQALRRNGYRVVRLTPPLERAYRRIKGLPT